MGITLYDNPRKALQFAMQEEPLLTRFGLGVYQSQRCNPRERHQRLQEGRALLTNETETLQAIMSIFAEMDHMKTFLPISSYGIKHDLEVVTGRYIPNGVCIAAAIVCGFRWKRCDPTSPNVYFNMRKKDVYGLRAMSPEQDVLQSIPLKPSVRFAILKRDNFQCQLCGAAHIDGRHVRLEVDHKMTRHNGGSNHPDNLWTLCWLCNRGKGTQDLLS